MESCAVLTTSDWHIPFLEYFIKGFLPDNHEEAYHLRKLATRYFVKGGILFQKGFNGEPLRCLRTPKHNRLCKRYMRESVVTIKAKGDFSSNCLIFSISSPP